MSLGLEKARAAAGGYGIAAAYDDIDTVLAERDSLRKALAKADAGKDAATAEAERLAGQLGTEQFRTKGWRDRALVAEDLSRQHAQDLSAARADVMRLTALLGQGLDLIDTATNGPLDTVDEDLLDALRTALTVAPGERNITADGKCGHNGGQGTGAGHVCVCIRGMNHPFDSERPHGCSGGALWTDGDR
ncbi:hypothetical protein [Rhodococcus sp. DMU1]|uniref:hypothetical protein n=1 Tax=Rhodococcus sp. DMU1 TaxID=2722825 RepID=UPI001FF0BE08|nr:hypothetical protein [Rhodococcus sp. DMU1]